MTIMDILSTFCIASLLVCINNFILPGKEGQVNVFWDKSPCIAVWVWQVFLVLLYHFTSSGHGWLIIKDKLAFIWYAKRMKKLNRIFFFTVFGFVICVYSKFPYAEFPFELLRYKKARNKYYEEYGRWNILSAQIGEPASNLT